MLQPYTCGIIINENNWWDSGDWNIIEFPSESNKNFYIIENKNSPYIKTSISAFDYRYFVNEGIFEEVDLLS